MGGVKRRGQKHGSSRSSRSERGTNLSAAFVELPAYLLLGTKESNDELDKVVEAHHEGRNAGRVQGIYTPFV